MQKIVLKNGLTVLFERKPGKAVVIQVLVKAGSNHEQPHERGITHFIEHMIFEGTSKRPTNQQISNEIEKIGGDFNAYTTNERTCVYVKVLAKHFSRAMDVLSDVLANSLFREEDIRKEKNVVLNEIDLVNDEPKFYQWVVLQKTLFQKHPCRFPTYGDKKIIRKLTQQQLVDYFQRCYVPKNMIVSIVGNVDWRKEIRKLMLRKGKALPHQTVREPGLTRNVVVKEKRNIATSYVSLGFKTVPRIHPDSYPLEVINGILGRGQSGTMFTEIRGKRGLAYDVGTQHIAEISFGYFAAYASVDEKNVDKVRDLMLEELQKIKRVTKNQVKEAQDFIEGDYYLSLEEPQKNADQLLYWEQVKDAQLREEYIL